MADLVRLHKDRAGEASAMLGRAFHGYPLLQQFFPDQKKRERVARYFFSIPLYYGIDYGEAYATSPELEGLAVWIHSGDLPFSNRRLMRAVPISTLLGFALSGGSRLSRTGQYIDGVHQRLAPFEHWFLQVIGVEPSCQGKGYARVLLEPMLSRIDEEGLPCYLETLNEKNVSLYRHFGFELMEESAIPGTQSTTWAMLRQAI